MAEQIEDKASIQVIERMLNCSIYWASPRSRHRIVAGLSISAPTDRHNPDWVAQIKDTATAISHALGCR